MILKGKQLSGVVTHACNPALGRLRQGRDQFQAIGTAWWETASEDEKKTTAAQSHSTPKDFREVKDS